MFGSVDNNGGDGVVAHAHSDQSDAFADIHEAIQKHVESIGPKRCPAEDGGECTGDIHDESHESTKNAMLSEWVVVMNWTDVDTGRSYSTQLSAPQMLRTHAVGLMYDWLQTLT
jgi:hypothetical protein